MLPNNNKTHEHIKLSGSDLQRHYERCGDVILPYCREGDTFRALVGDHNHWWDTNSEKGTAKLFYPNSEKYRFLTRKYRTLYWTTQFFTAETANIEKPFKNGKIVEQIGGRKDTFYHSFILDLDTVKKDKNDNPQDVHTPGVIGWLEKAMKFFVDTLTDAGVRSFGVAFSGGGMYCVLHPRLGELGGIEKDDYEYRLEVWQKAFDSFIKDTENRFREKYPDAKDWVKFDKLNFDKKRQIKALLVVHKSFPYAVIPLDKNNPKIDLKDATLPISDAIIESGKNWLTYQNDSTAFGKLLSTFLSETKKTTERTHGVRVVAIESEEIPQEHWATCIKNLLTIKTLKTGAGASRALGALASYMRYMGVPEEKAHTIFRDTATKWGATTSNLFERWYNCEGVPEPQCFVPSCAKIREKGGGYPHITLGDLGICTPDDRCKQINSPIYYHQKFKKLGGELRDVNEYRKIKGTNEDGTPKYEGINYTLVAHDLTEIYHFKTFRDTEQILYYNDGFYQYNGEALIKEKVEERLGGIISTRGVHEVIGHVQRSTHINRDEVNIEPTILNFKNGLYNIKTHEFTTHTPKYLITTRITVDYDPLAECPNIEKFLKDVVDSKEGKKLLEEIPAFCLYRRYFIKKAIMLTGGGDNGKSIYLNLVEHFLGEENHSSIILQKLTLKDRFTNAFLDGKLANIAGDLSSDALKDTGMFKMLTGGDFVPAEIKGGKIFKFKNTAKMIFSANEIPATSDLTTAFWTRWIIIDFPFKFVDTPNPVEKYEKQKVAEELLIEKLITPEEMSGFLNIVLSGLKTLLENRVFSYSKTTDEIEEEYRTRSSNIYGFIKEWCVTGSEMKILKADLFAAYSLYCNWNNKFPESIILLGKELPKIEPSVDGKIKPQVDNKQQEAWGGISLNENFMSFIENNSSNSGYSGYFSYSKTEQIKSWNSILKEKGKNRHYNTYNNYEIEDITPQLLSEHEEVYGKGVCEGCGKENKDLWCAKINNKEVGICIECIKNAIEEEREKRKFEKTGLVPAPSLDLDTLIKNAIISTTEEDKRGAVKPVLINRVAKEFLYFTDDVSRAVEKMLEAGELVNPTEEYLKVVEGAEQ